MGYIAVLAIELRPFVGDKPSLGLVLFFPPLPTLGYLLRVHLLGRQRLPGGDLLFLLPPTVPGVGIGPSLEIAGGDIGDEKLSQIAIAEIPGIGERSARKT
ncbi:hypothetical protein [Mesorhizobium sp. B2-2-2]|uniref:hypothetical protein n=1 Tax=Mesorhizobium sp. B2-2-2 TaxID=2589964 RepID=UPI001AEE7894|nr:hypothetical protein [Mesorhizobium sp. B2-2-2]